MLILDKDRSLRDYLLSQHSKSIRIVAAFASNTEEIVSALLKQKNKVELIVGTINAFTPPKFIDWCVKNTSRQFVSFVDFRHQSSIHWKLYAVGADIIVIGSANFTKTGISLERDTCLVVQDPVVFRGYSRRIEAIKNAPGVMRAQRSKSFDEAFEKYSSLHERSQAAMAVTKTYSNLSGWLADESNESLPLFIWDSSHTPKDKVEADELLKTNTSESDSGALREFYTYEAAKDGLPYRQGDIVLCTGARGGYMKFYVFDRIIFSRGRHFIYSYKRKVYPAPFNIEPIRNKIKLIIPQLYEEERTILERSILQAL